MDTNVETQVWEDGYVSIFFLFHSPFYVYSRVKLLVFISSCFGNSELNVLTNKQMLVRAAENKSTQNRRCKNEH